MCRCDIFKLQKETFESLLYQPSTYGICCSEVQTDLDGYNVTEISCLHRVSVIPYSYPITLESSIFTKSCLTLPGLVCLDTGSSIASFLLLVEWDLIQLWLCGFCLFS